tara:strand:+ start:785 stop:1132 length:348 start_codon:yes stop_codon:yes gene_type:complete
MNKIYSLVIIFISFFIVCNCFKLIENHGNYKISGEPIPSNSEQNIWACEGPSIGCHKHGTWQRNVDGEVITDNVNNINIRYSGGTNLSGTHNINLIPSINPNTGRVADSSSLPTR